MRRKNVDLIKLPRKLKKAKKRPIVRRIEYHDGLF